MKMNLKTFLLAAVCACTITTVSAKQMEGNYALSRGHYIPGNNNIPGYTCEWHAWEVCTLGPGGDIMWNITYWDDLMPFGILRIAFSSPWGSGLCGFSYNTPLPSSIASQLGYPSLNVVAGTYTVTYNAMYPNGYIDVNVAP